MIERPPCGKDYGCDFPIKKIATLILKKPSDYDSQLNDENSILSKILFKMHVNDQEWGGTNQAHVRYQINGNTCVKAFTVNKKDNPKNKYTFMLNDYRNWN